MLCYVCYDRTYLFVTDAHFSALIWPDDMT